NQLLHLAKQRRVRFVAVSQAVKSRAIEFGIAESRIDIAYSGLDTSYFTPGTTPMQERERIVLYVGRLVENKGAHVLLQAFEKIQEVVKDATLVIVGDGPMR